MSQCHIQSVFIVYSVRVLEHENGWIYYKRERWIWKLSLEEINYSWNSVFANSPIILNLLVNCILCGGIFLN